MLSATGDVPRAIQSGDGQSISSLDQIRVNADRPIVIFPECTTSNNRGLLRFAELFGDVKVPVTNFKVFIMCVR